MEKIDIKMHSVLVFVGKNKETIAEIFGNQIAKKDQNMMVDKFVNFNDNVNFNCEFLISTSEGRDGIIEFSEKAKKEEFAFKIINTDEAVFATKKDPLFKYVSNADISTIFNIENYTLWKSCHEESGKDIMFVGDIHENIEPVKKLLENVSKETQVVFLGDYLDKGGKTKETVLFMEEMLSLGAKIVVANHESYVAKRLLGQIDGFEGEEEIFSSLPYLFENKDIATKVIDIYNQSLPFYVVEHDGKKTFATHAPCKPKYLGKLSSNAQRSQRNFYFKERSTEAMVAELSFLLDDDFKHNHVFGHVAHEMDDLFINNRYWLDTGSVYGNKLSALVIKKDGEKEIIQISGESIVNEKLFSFTSKKKPRP